MPAKTRFYLIFALVAAAVGVAWYRSQVYRTPTTTEPPSLIMVTGGSSPYWQLLARGGEAAAQAMGAHLEVKILPNDEDVEAQTTLFAKMDTTGVDGIALSPLDALQQTRLINELAQKTVVVTVDSDAPLSNRLCYIGASNIAAGRLCARLVKEAIPDGGEVAVLVANLTKNNVLERKQALEEDLATRESDSDVSSAKYEIVSALVDEGDLDRCVEQLKQVLAEHPNLACIAGLNSYHGGQIVKALKEKELLNKVKVVAFDTEDATLAALEQGYIYATVAQDPYHYGYQAVRWLADNSRQTGSQLPLMGTQNTVHISTRALHAGDVAEFRQRYRELLGGAADHSTP
jgi:ribose transport system substrate-binding protein